MVLFHITGITMCHTIGGQWIYKKIFPVFSWFGIKFLWLEITSSEFSSLRPLCKMTIYLLVKTIQIICLNMSLILSYKIFSFPWNQDLAQPLPDCFYKHRKPRSLFRCEQKFYTKYRNTRCTKSSSDQQVFNRF